IASLVVLAALGNALIVGCSKKSEESSGAGAQQTPSATGAPTDTSTHASSAAAGGDLAAIGAQVYKDRCVLCHGPLGQGDAPAAAGLTPKPRNHTDGAYMNSRTNDQLIQVIKNGKGSMPAWGTTLTDAQVRAVLTHVRSLAQPPYTGPMP